MKVILAPEAIADLNGALAYLAERSPSAARHLRGRIFSIIESLADDEFDGPEDQHPAGLLGERLGAAGTWIEALARGLDPRPVEPDRDPVSIGAEETFERDLIDGPALRRYVTEQAERVAKRLRSQHLVARVVVLKLKSPDFHITTRRRTLDTPTSDGRILVPVALSLLGSEQVGSPGVRLSGVQATALLPAKEPLQLSFDDGKEGFRQRSEKLAQALDAIQSRFGAQALGRADLVLEGNEEDDGDP